VKQLDVERLLQWAYQDELSKGGEQAFSPWEPIIRYGDRGGVALDDAEYAGRLPPIFGEPHPDARVIERAVNALGPIEIDPRGHPHKRTTVLVMIHAKYGSRPDWYPEPIRIYPIRNGSRVHIVGESKGRDRFGKVRYSPGAYCPLRFEPSIADVEHGRRNYTLWRNALETLAETLQLRDHVALRPSAPQAPWLEQLTGGGKSLTDLGRSESSTQNISGTEPPAPALRPPSPAGGF
jgi:hypothetical protein